MNLRSGRRLDPRPPPQHDGSPCHRHGPGGADRISSLPDDMIIQVLTRMHCSRTAVRTGLLSRRWRGLWTRLTDLAFRGVGPATVEAALSSFADSWPAAAASLLDICLPSGTEPSNTDSMLRAAARFSPARLVFTIPPCLQDYTMIHLPCFRRATSMDLDTDNFAVMPPPEAGEFPLLEELSISGSNVHTDALVTRCPCLRLLRAKFRCLGPYEIGPVLGSLKQALGSRDVAVSLLDICVSEIYSSHLESAAELSPREFVIHTDMRGVNRWNPLLNLPCFHFHRTTSIEINWQGASFELRPCTGEFSALERLHLSGCNIVNLSEFVSCCPRLRVLKVDDATSKRDIVVHSTSLEELVLGTYKECRGIDIVTPMLKRLAMEVHAERDLGMSVSTPIVEKVAWRRLYKWSTPLFGFLAIQNLSLRTVVSSAWLSVQRLPHTHVLSMDMYASEDRPLDTDLNFAQEIEKLPVTDFSVVDLRLQAMGHVYGATLLHLLRALPVHDAIKILTVTLLRPHKFKVTQACIENCSCCEPKNWKSQSISLTFLEQVEIIGFKGEDHGFDFLKLMLRCAPMLKKVTVKLGNKFKSYANKGCTNKIYNISLAYPSVNFYVYLSCGSLVLHPC